MENLQHLRLWSGWWGWGWGWEREKEAVTCDALYVGGGKEAVTRYV